MANSSVDIALKAGLEHLRDLGDAALYTSKEIETIIRAAFVILRTDGGEKTEFEDTIRSIINNVAERTNITEGPREI